jgi:uncharacterized membrane protein (UPF0127 family)
VYVYNKTRETFLGTEVAVANSYLLRLVGLIGKTARWAQSGRGLWIIPCHGVHTIGMLFPIDLVFLSKEKQVVLMEEHLRPFRISQVSLKAASVLELPAHSIYRTGTKEGDYLEIAWLRKEAGRGFSNVERPVEAARKASAKVEDMEQKRPMSGSSGPAA